MPEITTHVPGSFCWAEVATTDAKRAKAFYSELFGWTFDDMPPAEFGVYTMCMKNGKQLGGLYQLPPELLKQGVPPHWMSYIAVANADAASEKIKTNGGKIQQGPFDVMDKGRMAICQDPTGAVFSIWQPKSSKGSTVMGESGTPGWFELHTKGVEKAEKFYKDVFGWSVKLGNDSGMVYRELSAAGARMPMGGMMEKMPQQANVPPHWMIYFTVADCDGDVQRAKSLGGRVYMPPMDIPKVGRFSVLADPSGATFAIIQLSRELSAEIESKQETKSAASAAPAKTSKKK